MEKLLEDLKIGFKEHKSKDKKNTNGFTIFAIIFTLTTLLGTFDLILNTHQFINYKIEIADSEYTTDEIVLLEKEFKEKNPSNFKFIYPFILSGFFICIFYLRKIKKERMNLVYFMRDKETDLLKNKEDLLKNTEGELHEVLEIFYKTKA